MKKIVIFLCFVLCLCGISYAATRSKIVLMNKNIQIQYNGNLQSFQNVKGVKVYPLSLEGTTYLPIRAVSSLFREKIKWDGTTNSIYLGEGIIDTTASHTTSSHVGGSNENVEVLVNEDVKIYYYNQLQTFTDVNAKRVYPLSYEGTTYLPIRAISNLFGLDIRWDGVQNKISISQKEEEIKVNAVKLNKTLLSLNEGTTEILTATITPTNAKNKNVTWSSSNTSVATVSNGKVTAVKAGTAIITVKTIDGNKLASCTVTVKTVSQTPISVLDIQLNKTSMSLEVGKSETLIATITPTNATNKNIIWSSSNTSVASVYNGKVIGLKEGIASIIATTEDGNKKVNCIVSVQASGSQVVSVAEVKLNKTSMSLEVGKSEILIATITPTNATNKNVTWSSSNSSVATVTSGKVTAVKAGTAIITVKTIDGNKSASCTVTVNESSPTTIAVSGVSLNKTSMSLEVGKSETLTATITPNNATNKNVMWSSSNSSVASVTSGKVTAEKTGTAIIIVKTEDGNKLASCTVTVKASTPTTVAVSGVSLNKTSMSLEVGKSETLTATITPTNATNKNVTWSSSNSNVATVINGKVTAVKAGTAIITVKTEDGNKLASCTVTVKASAPTTVAVSGVSLNKTSMNLEVGKSDTLTATITPTNATNKNVMWSSSNSSVASVTSGKVTAVKTGTAIITVKTEDGNKLASCTVTVKASAPTTVAVSGVSLNKTSMNLEVGKSDTLTATITPTSATNKNVTWSSSNTSVATVTSGKVTAVKTGTAIITVKTVDGNKSAGCTVTVKASTPATMLVTKVKLNKTSMKLEVGKSETLTATITPTNATNKNVTWSSSNTNIVTVFNGKVTAKKAGIGIITVKAADGSGKTDSCVVTVKSPNTSPQIKINTFDQRNKAVIAYFNDGKRDIASIFKTYCKGKSLKGYQPAVYDTKLKGNINVYSYNEKNGTKTLITTVSKSMLTYYLVPGNTYYLESASDKTQFECVKITGSLRMIYVPGIYNVRDLGGWDADGGTLKYGKIYRGAYPYNIKNEAVFDHLNIKRIVNLLSASSYKSSLKYFKSIEKVNAPPGMYLNTNKEGTNPRKAIRYIMNGVISNKNVFFHCQVGTDRTGTVAYIVEGLLGVPKEQRLDDYELSYLYRELTNRGLTRKNITKKNGLYDKINKYSTTNKEQEKFINWFLSGSKDKSGDLELINKFRKAMIDGNPKEYQLVNGKLKEK